VSGGLVSNISKMEKKTFVSHSPEETIKFAKTLSKKLKSGDVLALIGDLGSGKTTFIKGIAMGFGLKDGDEVKSPTFALMHTYPTKIPIYHFDLYRLEKPKELLSIGFDEFLSDPNAISCVEWADKFEDFLPNSVIRISFKILNNKSRQIDIL
jgi:tRNA threonylcarbamoyladenosine biosynthesis protein TsaE